MESMAKRVVIYLDPDLHEVLQRKAARSSCSLSALVNMTIRESFFEYDEYLASFDERTHESLISYGEVLQNR